MKSAKLEWVLGEIEKALALLNAALERHAEFAKLWMMLGEIEEERGNFDTARDVYTRGVGGWVWQWVWLHSSVTIILYRWLIGLIRACLYTPVY